MLGADLVDARAKDGELVLRPVDKKTRAEALALAERYLAAARASVGRPRAELEEAWNDVDADAAAARRKLALGLRKLVSDACVFEAEAFDAVELRRALFSRAAEARRSRGDLAPFDREGVVAEVARALGLAPEDVERGVFSDLRAEHVLRAAPTFDAASLVDAWELARAQAVLLASVRVTCDVRSASPGLLRAFFAKLKFHRLLFTAERIGCAPPCARPTSSADEPDAWRIVLEGPYTMFDAVTKYGLRLALVLPALRALERWSLVADVRWGKTRTPLVFRLAGGAPGASGAAEPHLSDDVRELLDDLAAQKSGWRARVATAILDVAGLGVCVPDVELRRDDDPAAPPVFVEVLGFWSRDAVFRRVELVERGLGGGARVVFAVSARLRVSAEVLGDDLPASLYVYKGRISARALLAQVDRVSRRDADAPRPTSAAP